MRSTLQSVVRSNVVLWRLYRFSGRARWPTKARFVRGAGLKPRDHLGHVLWDPEVESHTYRLGNEDELVALVAEASGTPRATVAGWLAEVHADPELSTLLARRVRLRPWLKARQELGNRMLWYLLARQVKPALIVETGIYDGLGSLVLLRALARNAEEGAPGELLSVDDVALSGELVPDHLTGSWTKLVGRSDVDLEPALAGRRVGVLFQDTPHTEENQQAEFSLALRHAADELVLVEGSGGYCPTLAQLAAHLGVERRLFRGAAAAGPATSSQAWIHVRPDDATRAAFADGWAVPPGT